MTKKKPDYQHLKKKFEELKKKLEEERQTRLQLQDNLNHTKNFFLGAINAIDDPIFVKNENHNWVYLNDAFCKRMGHSKEELLGKNDYDFFSKQQADIFRDKDDLVLKTGESNQNVEEITWEGKTRKIATTKSFYKDSVTGKKYIIGTIRDVTDQKKVEEELHNYRSNLEKLVRERTKELTKSNKQLHKEITQRKNVEEAVRESEERYRAVVEQSMDCIFLVDFETKQIEDFNPSLEKLLGYSRSELKRLEIYDFVYHAREDIDEKINLIKKHKGLILGEHNYITKTGDIINVDVSISPIIYGGKEVMCIVARDITERKKTEEERRKLEEKMKQSQKLESLGILAGGIAHDYNNMLMGVLGNASLLLEKLSPSSPLRSFIENIETSAKRLADLSQQLLAYSGRGKFMVQPINLSELVEDMFELIKVSVSKNATINCNLAKDIPLIEADSTQIRQIIMNVIINASEAIGQEIGVINISTHVMECDKKFLSKTYFSEGVHEGEYSYFEISDTGCGMDPKTIEKIFEPYFTTKFTGRGLGLAAVMGIVKGHGGALWLKSKQGAGTFIKVLFPALEKGEPITKKEPTMEEKSFGDGYVLLVDDDDVVRSMANMMLTEMGFGVFMAANGREAIRLFKENDNKIKFVLLDLTMPEMGGEETFEEIRKIKSDIPVVFSSGYTQQEIESRYSGDKLVNFLQKPYRLADLSNIIKNLK
jgi:PAS domain S-box-containing protein